MFAIPNVLPKWLYDNAFVRTNAYIIRFKLEKLNEIVTGYCEDIYKTFFSDIQGFETSNVKRQVVIRWSHINKIWHDLFD